MVIRLHSQVNFLVLVSSCENSLVIFVGDTYGLNVVSTAGACQRGVIPRRSCHCGWPVCRGCVPSRLFQQNPLSLLFGMGVPAAARDEVERNWICTAQELAKVVRGRNCCWPRHGSVGTFCDPA